MLHGLAHLVKAHEKTLFFSIWLKKRYNHTKNKRAEPEEQDQDLVSNKQIGVTSEMVGDLLGLILVIPVNKTARRAGEMHQIVFEIDFFQWSKGFLTCYIRSSLPFLKWKAEREAYGLFGG